MRVWLLRHGETDDNRAGIFQGQFDSPLNESGRYQAAATAAAVAKIDFQRIYSSDLTRALHTAEAVAQGRPVHVLFDRDLREMHYGILQGARIADAPGILAEYGLDSMWDAGAFATKGLAPPGGESCRMVCNRVNRFLRHLEHDAAQGDIDNVMVVAHGGLLRIMMTRFLDLPLSARRKFAFANCGLSRVRSVPDGWTLELHNSVLWDD